jgi:thiamine pyrophosphate-dependent acetolactate synthase large subunit-like protein
VVCVVGDGGLTMLMGEIATLVKYRLLVCVIVIKNNVLGQIKREQMILDGNPEFGVELEPIDFAKVARRARRAATRSSDRRMRSTYCARRWRNRGPRWCRQWSTRMSLLCRAR